MANLSEGEVVVFLEANPFASRLHVLGPLVTGAAAAGKKCFVVMPHREDGTDWTAFALGLPPDAEVVRVPAVSASPGAMIASIELGRLLLAAKRLVAGHRDATIVLTAVDDYIFKMLWISIAVRALFGNARLLAVRYRVEDLVRGTSLSLRLIAKMALARAVDAVARPEWIIFDERIARRSRVHLVPDPWSGPFSPGAREESRSSLGWESGRDVVLLVGRQDARKGIDVAAKALSLLHDQRPSIRVVLIGRVAEGLLEYRRLLETTFGNEFVQIERYVTDSELATYFSASSVVLLPYHSQFTSTSGVLVRSAASGTPVVGSSHGLIGWRIRRYSLGLTFTYPNHEDLAAQILRVLHAPFENSKASDFANFSTTESLKSRFQEIVST